MKKIFFILCFLAFVFPAIAQNKDTLIVTNTYMEYRTQPEKKLISYPISYVYNKTTKYFTITGANLVTIAFKQGQLNMLYVDEVDYDSTDIQTTNLNDIFSYHAAHSKIIEHVHLDMGESATFPAETIYSIGILAAGTSAYSVDIDGVNLSYQNSEGLGFPDINSEYRIKSDIIVEVITGEIIIVTLK